MTTLNKFKQSTSTLTTTATVIFTLFYSILLSNQLCYSFLAPDHPNETTTSTVESVIFTSGELNSSITMSDGTASALDGSETTTFPDVSTMNTVAEGEETIVATTTTKAIDKNQTPSIINERPSEGEETSTMMPINCLDTNYCLNGGKCIINKAGKEQCICLEGFSGSRCQTRDICKSVIADSLTGDQICARIDRACFKNDKFFRCSCHENEYFVFKINQSPDSNKRTNIDNNLDAIKQPLARSKSDRSLSDILGTDNTARFFSQANEEPMLDNDGGSILTKAHKQANYLAECRKIDKCLGVRCRQMSEICIDGQCICNQEAGYLIDPNDGLCKLLDPCTMPTPDGEPICGQAKCVATHDKELYKCLCPVGYRPVKVGALKSSTQCALLTDTICEIPLLNKCQHLCQTDRERNTYKCSCLPGYKPGKRPGVDDYMCFFDVDIDGNSIEHGRSLDESLQTDKRRFRYKRYKYLKAGDQSFNVTPLFIDSNDKQINYDSPSTSSFIDNNDIEGDDSNLYDVNSTRDIDNLKTDEYFIRRELITKPEGRDTYEGVDKTSLIKMSEQDRCNYYCGENKICVLEGGTTDSYHCVCDRQGYISVGDRCLNWCAAAEFSYRVRGLLFRNGCWTGVCKPIGSRPLYMMPADKRKSAVHDEPTELDLLSESSWRPQFECDCSSSPFLKQDSETKLCQLDFRATLDPCLPGNVGYIDCVENKNAFCAVLHRPSWPLIRDFLLEKYKESTSGKMGEQSSGSKFDGGLGTGSKGTNNSKSKVTEKLYTCVCSPEKKFLVDKPRNKERCVDECGLLNIECGRFNRMCRSATIAPDDFGRNNLVRFYPDGVRMNFRRTGCECLPGFNVGPSESVDFTLDDEDYSGYPRSPANGGSINPDGYPMGDEIIEPNDLVDETEHLRAKYMNINSSCLLDYDVVEYNAAFKAPADFDPNWINIRNPLPHPEGPGPNKVEHRLDSSSGSDIPDSGNGSNRSDDVDLICDPKNGCHLKIPDFMRLDVADLHQHVVLVAQCEPALFMHSIDAYQQCIRYRYWVVQKLRRHFIDWRRVITKHLTETFDLMDGNIKIRVNKCEATLRSVSTIDRGLTDPDRVATSSNTLMQINSQPKQLDPLDQHAIIDADLYCELTLHSANGESKQRNSQKVLLEKQLQKFIFPEPANKFGDSYYLMAPKMLIRRESFDQLNEHRKLFSPCKSQYAYCDSQTECDMFDTVNFTCTCKFGYTPIGSRDIFYGDSRKEVCEDIDECLFDVCKELANVSKCENTIGDYKCLCKSHYTGDNKRFCTHVCNTIPCKHGRCRLVAEHHAFCECEDGYKEADCSVQDPNVALRKANMIITGSIFTSVLLLMVTLAINLNSQLKKTKKKLKRLEAINNAANLFDFHPQQAFRPRMSKVSSGS